MSLSIYDPTKGCFVLNPKEFTPVINAFHPDYVKTYHPDLLTALKTEASQRAHGAINGAKSKATRESVKGKTVNSIHVAPKTKAKAAVDLAPKDFHVFSKAKKT